MKLFLRLSLLWIILLLGPLSWLGQHGITLTRAVRPPEMAPQGGYAMSVPAAVPWIFSDLTDGMDAQTISTLRVFEDGKELGPPHTLHDTIRGKGHGAFSHWDHQLYLSSSDGSDPRTNGRTYSFVVRTYLKVEGSALLLTVPLALLACGILLVKVVAWIIKWRPDRTTASLRTFRDLFARTVATRPTGAGARSFLSPNSLARVAGLTALYGAALLMIYGSLVAQRSSAGTFKINFEYKVF